MTRRKKKTIDERPIISCSYIRSYEELAFESAQKKIDKALTGRKTPAVAAIIKKESKRWNEKWKKADKKRKSPDEKVETDQ